MWDWLSGALRSVVSRGTLLQATRAQTLVVQVQLLSGEVVAEVEAPQPYGFSAVPAAGQVTMLTVGGVRDHKLMLAIDNPATRIRDLANGELGISDGASQVVMRGWGLELSTPAAAKLQADGAVAITGSALALGLLNAVVHRLVDDRFVALYNGHTHASNGAAPSQQMAIGAHTTTTTQAS